MGQRAVHPGGHIPVRRPARQPNREPSESCPGPGFQESSRLGDQFETEDPLVYGGQVLHAV
jgi:hypothetical protein